MRARRSAILCAAVLLLGVTTGRAAAGERTVKSLDGIPPGKRVRIEGTVSLRGSTPFTLLAIEMGGGAVAMIESRSSEIRHELKSLGGMRVAVAGAVLPRIDDGPPRLDVDRYEVLPLPGGERPIVGAIELEDDACVVVTRDGNRYWILGDLEPALRDYAGARVWIVGHKGGAGRDRGPKKSTPFTPTGYGVIDQAPAR
jgi:hypothetical protein